MTNDLAVTSAVQALARFRARELPPARAAQERYAKALITFRSIAPERPVR
jgi:hypothetical protein